MSYDHALEHHLQRMLMADFGLTWEAVQPDDDGEVCFLDAHGRLLTARIVDLGTPWARLYVTAATGLKRSAKLLREVNELNLSLLGCRALLTPDGRLVLTSETLLEALEPGVLAAHADVISENAERSGSMIRLMFGATDEVVGSASSDVEG